MNKDKEHSLPFPQIRSQSSLHPIAQDPHGYVAFALFMFYSFLIGTSFTPFSPIFRALGTAYGLGTSSALLSTVAFIFGKLLFAVPGGILLNHCGLRAGIFASLYTFLIGSLLRFGIEDSWSFVLAGQVFCGVAGTVIISAQMELCKVWFPARIRGLFMTLTSFGFIFGTGFSLFFALLFVEAEETDLLKISAGVWRFNLANLSLAASAFGLHWIFFREAPRSEFTERLCPSEDLERQHRDPGLPEPNIIEQLPSDPDHQKGGAGIYKEFVRSLLAQSMFKVCLGTYLLLNVAGVAFVANINFILQIEQYPAFLAATCVYAFTAGGLIGAAIYARLFMNSGKFVAAFASYIFLGLCCFVVLFGAVFSGAANFWVLLLSFCFGFFIMMGTPTVLEAFVRVVKGVPFTFINGLVYFCAQSAATIVLGLLSGVYKAFGDFVGSRTSFAVIVVIYAAAVGLISRIKLK